MVEGVVSIDNLETVNKYVRDIVDRREPACKENIQSCKRYLRDLENDAYEFKPDEAEGIVRLIEDYMSLLEGEDKDGRSFNGSPFLLEPWQKFVVFNLFGFYNKGTIIRRYQEALLFIPKKNIKRGRIKKKQEH